MPDDSGGNNSLPPGYLAVTGQTVLASQHNPPLEDLSASMTRRYMRDGRTPMLGNVPMNGYRATGAGNAVDPQDYVTLAQMTAAISAVAGIPTGSIMFLASNVVPAGWLALNNQSVSRGTFAALWAFAQASGNLAATEGAKTAGQFGPGDGSTTFTLPNLYADGGYFIRPISSGRGIGTVQADEIKGHTHTGSTSTAPDHTHSYMDLIVTGSGAIGGGGGVGTLDIGRTTFGAGAHSHTLSINSTGGSETRPKNIAYPVLIKT